MYLSLDQDVRTWRPGDLSPSVAPLTVLSELGLRAVQQPPPKYGYTPNFQLLPDFFLIFHPHEPSAIF
jgi:hypothetical protein